MLFFLFNPRERSIYYRLYDLSPHLFLQVVFLVNIYFLSSLGLLIGGNGKIQKHKSKTSSLEVAESSITPILLIDWIFEICGSSNFL